MSQDYAQKTLDKRRDLYRADCLWRAVWLLKQDLALGHTKHEAGLERAHWLLDKYETELFAILAKHELNPRDYGY